jgi:hypothetical protein
MIGMVSKSDFLIVIFGGVFECKPIMPPLNSWEA